MPEGKCRSSLLSNGPKRKQMRHLVADVPDGCVSAIRDNVRL